MAGEDHTPRVVDVGLAGAPLLAVRGEVGGGQAECLFEGRLRKGSGHVGVFDCAIAAREGSDLDAGAHSVLTGHLVADDAGAVVLIVDGRVLTLGIGSRIVLGLEGAGSLLIPLSLLLGDGGELALLVNTADLSVSVIDIASSDINSRIRHRKIEVRVSAATVPHVGRILKWVDCENHLVLVSTLAPAELSVNFQAPGDILLSLIVKLCASRFSISVAVLGGWWHTACVTVGISGNSTDESSKRGHSDRKFREHEVLNFICN